VEIRFSPSLTSVSLTWSAHPFSWSARVLQAPDSEKWIGLTVSSSIWTSYDHHGVIFPVVKAEVAHRRLEEVRVLGEPFWEVDRLREHSSGEREDAGVEKKRG